MNAGIRFIATSLLCGIVTGLYLPDAAAKDRRFPGEVRDSAERASIVELRDDLHNILEDPAFEHASIGAEVRSVASNEKLFSHNSAQLLLPASNVKLLTTAAALGYLGKDFHYTTSVYLDGVIGKKGGYVGNVFVRSSGDPTISNYFFDQPLKIFEAWADTFELLGITSIRGNFVGENTYFDLIPWAGGWAWDDVQYPFSAQISALSILDNAVEIAVYPGPAVDAPATVEITPDNSYIQVKNFVRTVQHDSVSDISFSRAAYTNIIELHGGIPFDSSFNSRGENLTAAIDNPTLYFLYLFQKTLERRGITFQGGFLDAQEWNEKIRFEDILRICDHSSPPLREIVRVVNSSSHNLCAEALLKTIAKEKTGIGSFANGADVVVEFVEGLGIPPESFTLVDGSGLSRLNLLSSSQIVTLLTEVYKSPYGSDFYESLARPGKTGTLSHRMTNTLAQNRLRAKTGSMNHTCTLSGYVLSNDDELLAFSILLNNFKVPQSLARNLQDLFCMRLASFSRASAIGN